MTTSGTITGDLRNSDYGDNVERAVESGTYDYSLAVSGDGKLAVKIETRELTGSGSRWVTVEEKSKVRGGTTLHGSFVAAETLAGNTDVRFNFNREFLGKGVDYTLTFDKD